VNGLVDVVGEAYCSNLMKTRIIVICLEKDASFMQFCEEKINTFSKGLA
jgi:hypothetical protein